MSRRHLILCAATPFLLSGCADAGSHGWAGTVADSAGIEIVQNPSTGLWAPDEGWKVEEVLAIGSFEGDEQYQFGRISGVDVDAEGNVYVADAQAQEVRVFDSSGAYVRTIGRPGSGPGELGNGVNGVLVTGTRVMVPDLGNARLASFSPDGTFLDNRRLDMLRGVPVRWDLASAGRVVVQLRNLNPADSLVGFRGDPLETLPDESGATDTIVTLPPGESVRMRGGVPQIRIFSPEPIWDFDAKGNLATGRNNELRFSVWSEDGALQRVITQAHEAQPVTDRDKRVFLNTMRRAMQDAGAPPQVLEQYLSSVEFAEHYPAFALLTWGPQGTLWVQRIVSGDDLAGDEAETFDPQDLGSKEWEVFDAEGRYLGIVRFPGKYQPIRTIGDRFYGIARDDMDVQSLKVFRVVTS